MSGVTEPLSAAIEWLKAEITRTPYGRLSIGVQVHDGKVAKVFRSVEESTLASQYRDARSGNDVSR
jgi:hypothetical protein